MVWSQVHLHHNNLTWKFNNKIKVELWNLHLISSPEVFFLVLWFKNICCRVRETWLCSSLLFISQKKIDFLDLNLSYLQLCYPGQLAYPEHPSPPSPMVISSNIGQVWLCHMPLSELKIGKQNVWPCLLKLISFHPRVGESARECMIIQ